MGLFGKLKDAVGIGSLKLEIALNAPGISPGEPIAGNVVLHSAASDTRVASILLQLVNFGIDVQTTDVITEDAKYGTQWETYERSFKHNTTLYEVFLAQDFVLAARQRLEIPFDIMTPPDLFPSDKQNRYVLKVHVDIPGQIDAKAAKPIKVLVTGGLGPAGGGAGYADPYGEPGGGDLPAPGERVLAFYEEAHYEATVLAVLPQGVHVQWGDGTDSVVPLESVLPSESAVPSPADLEVGMRVMAGHEDAFYEATVGAVQGAQVGITWDDGTQGWVAIHDVRLL